MGNILQYWSEDAKAFLPETQNFKDNCRTEIYNIYRRKGEYL